MFDHADAQSEFSEGKSRAMTCWRKDAAMQGHYCPYIFFAGYEYEDTSSRSDRLCWSASTLLHYFWCCSEYVLLEKGVIEIEAGHILDGQIIARKTPLLWITCDFSMMLSSADDLGNCLDWLECVWV